ncbi:MAG: hypothetical protein ACKV1O_16045 [Saprospiraceae bacterium]
MKKDQHLARINETLEQIHQNQKRIKDRANSFDDWLKQSQAKGMYQGNHLRRLGMGRTSVYNWIDKLKDLKSKIKIGGIQESEIEEKLEEVENTVMIYSQAITDYYVQYSKNIDPFEGQKWYVYFFLIDDETGREPAIGRVVLNTVSKNHVDLKNLGYGVHLDYEKGQYSLIYNYACFLELETAHGDRKLHIKVRYISSGFEIFIGSYITYENDHVVRGTVVMELARGEDIKPAVLSSFNNKELFYSIDPAIRSFLSPRRYNYQKISNKIFSLEGLRSFLHENQGEDWSTRFFEENAPTIFIAYPGLSLEEDVYKKNNLAIEKIVQRLNQKFKGKINIYYGNAHDRNPEVAMSVILEKLKKTRIFVLIYTKTNLGSYSLVQLGWAMAYCKVVMMFYELGAISERMEGLHKKIHKYPFENNLESENTCKIIYKAIEAKIEENCEKWLN